MPEPDETLDAPVYEPPKRRVPLVPILVTVAAVVILLCVVRVERHTSHPHPRLRTVLEELARACENFRLENCQYPWSKPSGVTATTEISGGDVYGELRGLPGARINTTKTDYLGDVPKVFLKDGALVDFWGREIRFRVNSSGLQAVIWSCGRNGIDETNDGDSPDPAKYPKGYYWFGRGDTGDDIVRQ